MGLLNEFKTFAMRGNVVDMAVGIIMGGAFGKIVSALVNDVILPPIGLLLGGSNFKDLKIILKEGSEGVPSVAIGYGTFLQTVVDFAIIAFSIFVVVKLMNSLKKKEEPAPSSAGPTRQEILLEEIRDLLRK